MVSPVCGLRPWRAERSEMANLQKPGSETSLPAPSSLAICSRVTSMASLAWPAVRPVSSATVFASSVLLMVATRDPPVGRQGRRRPYDPVRTESRSVLGPGGLLDELGALLGLQLVGPQLAPRDRHLVHLVGPVGEPQRAHVGVHRRQREVVGD